MKKFIIFFLFFSQSLLAQNLKQQVSSLNTNAQNWSCEKYAEGTTEKKIQITLSADYKFLIIQNKLPSRANANYIINTIDLSQVLIVETVPFASEMCSFIKIVTKPYGIKSKTINLYGESIGKDANKYFQKYGWADEFIRLENDSNILFKLKNIKEALDLIVLSSKSGM